MRAVRVEFIKLISLAKHNFILISLCLTACAIIAFERGPYVAMLWASWLLLTLLAFLALQFLVKGRKKAGLFYFLLYTLFALYVYVQHSSVPIVFSGIFVAATMIAAFTTKLLKS